MVSIEDFNKLPEYIRNKLEIRDDHWIWIGARSNLNRNDHKGKLRFQGRMEYSHRIIFSILGGFPLDSKFQVNHRRECPHSLCCNPDHLYAGTQEQNVEDSIALGHNKELRKTECSTCGSRYSTSPTTGHRYCQRCKNSRRRAWRHRND